MNVLDIIILVILVFSVFWGYKKGFLKTAFSLVSWVIVLVICNVATPMVTQMLIEKTDIEVMIQASLDAKINEMISEVLQESGISELPETLQEGVKIEIPEELKAALPEELRGLLLDEGFALEGIELDGLEMESITQNVIDTAAVAERIVGIVSLLIVLVFSRVAIWIAGFVLDVASKLPVIGPFDKVLGLGCGAVKGLVWSWLILAVISVLCCRVPVAYMAAGT